MITKWVSIYDRGPDGLYIHPSAFTDMGVLLAVPPFERIDAAKKPIEIWSIVSSLLEKSGGKVPHPTSWKQLAPMLALAGCRTWGDFARKARYCSVEIADGVVIVTPGQWDGKGFESRKKDAVNLGPNPEAAIATEAILRVLEA